MRSISPTFFFVIIQNIFLFCSQQIQLIRLDNSLTVMWQVTRYGETLSLLHKQTSSAWKNSAVAEESEKSLKIFRRRHTLLQRKRSYAKNRRDVTIKEVLRGKNQRKPRNPRKLAKVDVTTKVYPNNESCEPKRKSTRLKKKRSVYLQSQWLTQFETQCQSQSFLEVQAGKKSK